MSKMLFINYFFQIFLELRSNHNIQIDARANLFLDENTCRIL